MGNERKRIQTMTEIQQLAQGFTLTGDLARDVSAFLIQHGAPHTAAHVRDVAEEARRLALMLGENAEQAETAGWLHDVSTVIPNGERAIVAENWGVEVLPEEATFPMIIHQKLSVVLAREIFGVQDESVLSAIGCHTTLKANASRLDKVVFLADKLAWDQPGVPPYYDEMRAALEESLDAATLVYLRFLWDRRETLRVIHPWLVEAYQQLSEERDLE
jgi:predicted HD superfamily hydrolase involved in NAD metabolism